MTQHYFVVQYDTETSLLSLASDISLNYDGGNIWDPVAEEWVFGEEYEPDDQFATDTLLEALQRWNEGE